jgi:hypothetical protein
MSGRGKAKFPRGIEGEARRASPTRPHAAAICLPHLQSFHITRTLLA